ncbi:cation:proton antiporter [Helicobacter acinonychis]|uniref:Na+/H+ antiporter n=1 Tax=Helicobacter acinonychis (strain Sheeba) TaxID=382638 RepID=Q17YP5_HELAH|nr:cation:proton antiporter [Helicobacter acinonychis]CAJ99231.1 putative Na+/H+ antiporter [Helicobacter acinonychis str. Sheeba]STP04651.1 Na+/H+ antiporter [Helicobacter acinonychis]
MHAEFFTFALIMLLIVIAPYVSGFFRLPITVVEILFGSIGAYLGLIEPTKGFEVMSEIGFLFLMFLCGLEVEIYLFKKLGASLLKRILAYFLILYTLSFILTFSFGLEPIFMVIFPIVSLGMIMTLIKDYGKETLWLDLVLKVGVIGELLSIVGLVVVDGVYSHGLGVDLVKDLGILIVFLILIIVAFQIFKILFWWFPHLRLFVMPKTNQFNQDVRFSLMLFFSLVAIVVWLKIEMVLGAFLAGLVVSTFFPHKSELIHKLNDVGFGFFVPLFFIHVGSTLDLKLVFLNPHLILEGALIVAGMLGLHLIASSLLWHKYFKETKNLFSFALGVSMPLTFLVTTAAVGLKAQAILPNTYYALLLAAIFEGVLFTIVIKMLNKKA